MVVEHEGREMDLFDAAERQNAVRRRVERNLREQRLQGGAPLGPDLINETQHVLQQNLSALATPAALFVPYVSLRTLRPDALWVTASQTIRLPCRNRSRMKLARGQESFRSRLLKAGEDIYLRLHFFTKLFTPDTTQSRVG